MERQFSYVSGAALGAAAMYFFDPDRGRRRRALLLDQVMSSLQCLGNELDRGCRDAWQRTQGVLHDLRQPFVGHDTSDEILVERIRATLGRHVSHPRAIDVEIADGHVQLRGAILASEVNQLFDAVRNVPGVQHVDNQLEVHDTAEGISALQGGRAPLGESGNWTPATKLLVASTSGLMLAYGLSRESLPVCALGAAGLAFWAASSGTNRVSRRAHVQNRPSGRSQIGNRPATEVFPSEVTGV